MTAIQVPVTVFDNSADLARAAAAEIADGIERAARADRAYVLGCPGGRTPRETYAALSDEVRARELDLAHVVIAMMDDYVTVDADGRFTHVPADAHFSCRRFAHDEIQAPLNAAAPAGRTIPAANVWVPDPQDPAAFDAQVAAAGGYDLFLLASGAGDGHVAFNPPGSARHSVTRVVELADSTRQDNMETFPEFESLDDVPRHGVTVGIETIAGLSRRVLLLLTGPDKHHAFRMITEASGYDTNWPATVVHEAADAAIYADRAAAGQL